MTESEYNAMIAHHGDRLNRMHERGVDYSETDIAPQMHYEPHNEKELRLEVRRQGNTQYSTTDEGTLIRRNLPPIEEVTPS